MNIMPTIIGVREVAIQHNSNCTVHKVYFWKYHMFQSAVFNRRRLNSIPQNRDEHTTINAETDNYVLNNTYMDFKSA